MTNNKIFFSIQSCTERKKALFLCYQTHRELAEWSIAAVLKTVDCYRSGGSNPSLSTKPLTNNIVRGFLLKVRKTHTIPLNFLSKTPVNPTPSYKLAEIFSIQGSLRLNQRPPYLFRFFINSLHSQPSSSPRSRCKPFAINQLLALYNQQIGRY